MCVVVLVDPNTIIYVSYSECRFTFAVHPINAATDKSNTQNKYCTAKYAIYMYFYLSNTSNTSLGHKNSQIYSQETWIYNASC
jgi:hypothetical protein